MARLVRNEAAYFDHLQHALLALKNYHMRTSRMFAEVYGLEPASSHVFLTICLATSTGQGSRLPRAVSRLAIAQSTGLARETVRRKCAELADAGLILSHGRRGVTVAPGQSFFEQDQQVLRQALADTHQYIEALTRLGIFTIAPDAVKPGGAGLVG